MLKPGELQHTILLLWRSCNKWCNGCDLCFLQDFNCLHLFIYFFLFPSVIPNTLKVSPETPPPVIPEGSDLTLSCNVTRELTYPTYLSVTWSIKKGTTSEDILTFGPQGDVVTGSQFTRRYSDGGIRLVPGRNGLFELVITRLTTSDQGIYECKGTEWTHERGGMWTKIVESKKEMGAVTVTPTGKRNDPAEETSLSLMSF